MMLSQRIIEKIKKRIDRLEKIALTSNRYNNEQWENIRYFIQDSNAIIAKIKALDTEYETDKIDKKTYEREKRFVFNEYREYFKYHTIDSIKQFFSKNYYLVNTAFIALFYILRWMYPVGAMDLKNPEDASNEELEQAIETHIT